MELIRPGTDIDFLRYSKIAAVFSSLLVLIGLATFFVRGGLTYGVDFAGGTIVHVKFSDPPTIAEVRQVLSATLSRNTLASACCPSSGWKRSGPRSDGICARGAF